MKVEVIREREGLNSFTETVRACIRQWHDHKFYTKHKDGVIKPLKDLEPELTKPQICELKGGTVAKSSQGIPICKFRSYSVPLSELDVEVDYD